MCDVAIVSTTSAAGRQESLKLGTVTGYNQGATFNISKVENTNQWIVSA